MKNGARCDHSSPENIRHLVMQCPENEKAKEFMFKEIQKVDKEFEARCANSAAQVLYWLLGRHIDNVDVDVMSNIWIIAGHHISNMYRARIHSREGVG